MLTRGHHLEIAGESDAYDLRPFSKSGFSGIVYPHGGSVRYVRDALGRTIQQAVRTTANAAPLLTSYEYDAVGNLAKVTDPQGGETTFVYDAENRLTSRTLPNSVVTTYTYDDRDRPLSVVHRNAANLVLASRTYVRAPGGEPTRVTNEDGSYVEIGYDAALRITSEHYYTSGGELDDELSYTYDADGNRASKTVNGVVSTYQYASGARLTGITTAGMTESRTTDNGGRETALALMSHELALTYDSDDHVTRVVDGTTTTNFAFDAAGRRVGVTTGASSKRFLTAPNAGDGYESPQAVTDGSGALIASYVFAGETPIATSTPSGTQYYLTDAMGSVIATTGGTGILASTLEYDAFGNERTNGALAGDTYGDFRLHGMWKDPTGLYYVRARAYDAETGRFASRDPAEASTLSATTWLAYTFSNANPHIWIDPSGRESLASISVSISITSILSGISVGFARGLTRSLDYSQGSESTVDAEKSRAAYKDRLGQCLSETRLVDFEPFGAGIVDRVLDVLEGKYAPDAGDDLLDDITNVPGGESVGIGIALWQGSASWRASGKLLPLSGAPNGASNLAMAAYALRHFIVARTTDPGALRFAHQVVARVQTGAVAGSQILTPLFLAWGGHEGGAVLGCLVGSAL